MKQTTLFPPLDKDKGYNCPCCSQFVKRYKRALNSNMALVLLMLYKHNVTGYTHIENFMRDKGFGRSGDFSYLCHWRFLEKKTGNRDDGSNRNGMYRITPMGLMFVEGKIKAKAKILIYNNQHEGFEGEDITIKEALGTKFNYDELMNNF